MSVLLAVETSGSLCSLAICAGDRWFEDTQNVERLHNRVVLANLEALAATAGVARNRFDAVAFGAGPGSFTGVRIAASVAQGVAFASGATVLPVRSSLALASAARALPAWPSGSAGVITVTRSRRDAYYVAGYAIRETEPERHLDDALHQGDDVPEVLELLGWPGTGDRPQWWPEGLPFVDGVQITAPVIGRLGLAMLQRGEGLPPEAALPVYVTGDSPWRPPGS